MSLSTNNRGEARHERGVGNIFDRLDDARKKRERALETPRPANDDRPQFPRLKPPADVPTAAAPKGPLAGWGTPLLLAVSILALIFAFAVS